MTQEPDELWSAALYKLINRAKTMDANAAQWFAVYPGSEKLDLGPKRYIAIFKHEPHAKEFVKLWEPYGYVEPLALIDPNK